MPDAWADEAPALAGLAAASVQGTVLTTTIFGELFVTLTGISVGVGTSVAPGSARVTTRSVYQPGAGKHGRWIPRYSTPLTIDLWAINLAKNPRAGFHPVSQHGCAS